MGVFFCDKNAFPRGYDGEVILPGRKGDRGGARTFPGLHGVEHGRYPIICSKGLPCWFTSGEILREPFPGRTSFCVVAA